MRRFLPAVFLIGCALHQPLLTERAIMASPPYEKALKNVTRQGEARREFDTDVRAVATLLTPAFENAWRQEYLRVYGVPLQEPVLQNKHLTFIFALATDEHNANQLSAYQKLWTLSFSTPTTTVAPLRVDVFDHDEAFFRYFFPYWSPWRQMYKIEFPLDRNVENGTLHFRGVPGKIDLTW